MSKAEQMTRIANTVTGIIHETAYSTNRNGIAVRYTVPTAADIDALGDWYRRYHHLLPGEEYFMIWEADPTNHDHLLYVVNVTADAPLTALEELMHTVAAKF